MDRWLVVKNWLVQKKKKLELAPKRNWKKYWVCLKGTVLLFYDGDIDNVTLDDNVPRHMLGKDVGIFFSCFFLSCINRSSFGFWSGFN